MLLPMRPARRPTPPSRQADRPDEDCEKRGRFSVPVQTEADHMHAFDYGSEAELFPCRTRKSGRHSIRYRRFSHAAEAIRFAIEVLPADLLLGSYLQVDEARFDRHGILRLYESEAYPLARGEAGLPPH